jgi:hypothetical protein
MSIHGPVDSIYRQVARVKGRAIPKPRPWRTRLRSSACRYLTHARIGHNTLGCQHVRGIASASNVQAEETDSPDSALGEFVVSWRAGETRVRLRWLIFAYFRRICVF